ncbi:MAG: M16 family metallopeptidase [bacterium]
MPEAWRAACIGLLLSVLLIPHPGTAAPAPASGRVAPRLVRSVLDNGLTVIVEEHAVTDIVALQTWVHVGSKDEDDETNGVAHFIEHMLFKGTSKRKAGEMERAVEGVGGVLNAGTSDDWTYYYMVAAGRHFDQMLELQADAIMNSTIDPGELERERRVVIEEINRRDNAPSTRAFDLLRGVAFTSHPYRLTRLGPRAGIERMPREALVDFYRSNYVPGNTTVVVVGNVRAGETVGKVQRAYAGFRKGSVLRSARPIEPPMAGVRRTTAEQDVRVAYLALGFHGLAARDRDLHAADVLMYALGRGLGARLRQQIVERTRVAQSVSVSFFTTEDPFLFMIFAVTEAAQAGRAEAAILAELAVVREQGLTEAELVRAKNLLEGEHIYETHTTRGRAFDLGLAATVADLEFSQTYLERIRRVTREDVQRTARRIFDPGRYAVALIRPGGR